MISRYLPSKTKGQVSRRKALSNVLQPFALQRGNNCTGSGDVRLARVHAPRPRGVVGPVQRSGADRAEDRQMDGSGEVRIYQPPNGLNPYDSKVCYYDSKHGMVSSKNSGSCWKRISGKLVFVELRVIQLRKKFVTCRDCRIDPNTSSWEELLTI